MNLGHILFGFSGRINRGKYWLAILIWFIAGIVLNVILFAVAGGAMFAAGGVNPSGMMGMGLVGGIIALVFGIAIFISTLAVTIKRLHDRGKSGWWFLIFYVVPMVLYGVGITLGVSMNSSAITLIFSLAAVAIWIWAFVELACLRGTIGPNQYGPDPLPAMMATA